jgi:hypothetical protein
MTARPPKPTDATYATLTEFINGVCEGDRQLNLKIAIRRLAKERSINGNHDCKDSNV